MSRSPAAPVRCGAPPRVSRTVRCDDERDRSGEGSQVTQLGVRGLRELPSEVRALVGVAFMVALGFGLVAPAIPLFARQFGVGKTAASAVISAFAVMVVILSPPGSS